jgi:predicted nucleic acid-binding protein
VGQHERDTGMASDKVVVDASVVAKWFLDEVYSDKSLQLRDEYISGRIRLLTPSLMPFEVLNVLRYSRVYSKEELIGLVRSLELYGIDLWELRNEYGSRVAEVAIELDLSVYDASYVALAEIAKARLVTADEEIVSKAKSLIAVVHVKDLS